MSDTVHNETQEDPFGDTDVASMEDILASIRSLIAEDGDPAAPMVAPPPLAAILEAPVEAIVEAQPVDLPDAIEPISLAMQTSGIPSGNPAPVAPPISVVSDDADNAVSVSTDEFDLESLFEPMEMLETDTTLEAPTADIPALDASEFEMLDAKAFAEPSTEPKTLSDDEDIDLVKSLMSDLADAGSLAPFEDAASPVEEEPAGAPALDLDDSWFANDLSIPEVFEEAQTEDVVTTVDESAEVLLDEILEQSISDEEALNASEGVDTAMDASVAAVPTAAVAVAALSPPRQSEPENVISLTDIAARAEREAHDLSVETPAEIDLPQEIAVDAAQDDIAEPIVEDEPKFTPSPKPAPQPEALTQALEEEVMARSAPLEEIINDDVETETHNAFAELNRLVEEKNVFEEQGPRIGDLVQEALKPMLKEWLDANLKGIVERAVAKEVKRIATGK